LSVTTRALWMQQSLPKRRKLTGLLIGVGLFSCLAGAAEAQQVVDTTCSTGLQPSTMEADGCVGAPLGDSMRAFADSPAVSPRGKAAAYQPVQPNVLRALGTITLINAAAVAINHEARDIETAGPETWWQNLRGKGKWIWDGNNISTNNIEHPWGGAAYFNIARANGVSFWGAAPITMAGSLMWELFGEVTPPSRNDLLITSLSGINLGEPMLRMSDLVLNNEAYGLNRAWREAVVLIFNPGLGLTRLSRGQMWSREPNAPDSRPDSLQTLVVAGTRRLTLPARSRHDQMNVAFMDLGLQYGDPFGAGPVKPFSVFNITAELASGPATTVTELGTRGMLAALGRPEGPTNRVNGIFMDFEYQWNEQYQFSEQSIGIGTVAQSASAGTWRLFTDLSAELSPIVASSDAYAPATVSRDYDYGTGVGARAAAQVEYRGTRVLSAGYRGFWTKTINGASQSKLTQFAIVEARLPLVAGLSAGAMYHLYSQRSAYAERATVHENLPSYSLFISTGR
jgi:hypothetical protein